MSIFGDSFAASIQQKVVMFSIRCCKVKVRRQLKQREVKESSTVVFHRGKKYIWYLVLP